MKQLQNDFTTREQSKRLLELGLPADSANIHYQEECVRIEYGKEEFEYFLHYGKPDTNKYSTDIPSWSVGRLMEICDICILAGGGKKGEFCFDRNDLNKTYVQDMIDAIEGMFKLKLLDFSKLED